MDISTHAIAIGQGQYLTIGKSHGWGGFRVRADNCLVTVSIVIVLDEICVKEGDGTFNLTHGPDDSIVRRRRIQAKRVRVPSGTSPQ